MIDPELRRLGTGDTPSVIDAYLHLQTKRAGKVKGEVAISGHVGDIEVAAWSLGVQSSSALGSSAATQRRSYTALSITKQTDSATTALLSALASNDEVKEARLSLRRAGEGQQDFLTITLKQARVTGLELGGDGDAQTGETLSLTFREIEVAYRGQQASGSAGASHVFTDSLN